MSNLSTRLAQFERARQEADGKSKDSGRLIDGMGRDEILEKYGRKVQFIARRIMRRLPDHAPLELDDLINSGALGLLDAVDKYDLQKNTSFGTYVEFRIRGAILDLLRGLDPVSRTVREKSTEVQRVTRELEHRLGRQPESEEVADAMGISIGDYHQLMHEVRSVHLLPLDAPIGRANDGAQSLGEVLEDSKTARPDQSLNRKEAIRTLAKALEDGLPDRLHNVLVMYYFREMSLKEIGAVLDVSESRVSQLHTEALLRLRGKLASSLRPGETLDLTRRRPRTRRAS